MIGKAAGVALIISLVLGFMLYQPLHEDLDDRGLYQFNHVITSIVGFGNNMASSLFGWHFDLQRYFLQSSVPKIYPNYPDLEVNDLTFEGVPVRVYKLKSLRVAAPAIVFIHGGGWVIQTIDTYDATPVHLALNTSMIVISVEYRLAPENPYPAGFEDCLHVTKHVLKHGRKYGIDVNRVAISGDSSGGNFATAVAFKLAEEKSESMPALKLQVLIYPVTQVVNLRTSSYLLYKNYPLVNQKSMATYIASYLLQDLRNAVVTKIMENRHISSNIYPVYKDYFKKENLPKDVRWNPDEEMVNAADDNVDEDIAKKMDTLAVDPYVSPLLAQNLSQLPPAYVVVCEFDVLRDDGLLYVHRLRQAGVEVELSFVKNQPHAFMFFTPSSTQYRELVPEWRKIYRFLKKNV